MTLNLTTNGKELLTLVLAGEATLTFTKLSIGSGADAGEDAAALSSPVLSTTFAKQETLDNYAKLTAIFDNSSITTKTAVTETGIFADDPDNPGTDLLYAYGYADAEEADYIPPVSEAALEVQQTVYVYIAEAKTFSVTIDPNAAALATDLEAHIADTDNPHNVTAEQVGHITISMSANTTSTAAPAFGGTFTAVDSITKDSYGHTTKANIKTVTIPSTAATTS
ncbi:MAG: hypothetical protein LIO54_03730, partial [Oscillospiraceae bacterium]|nr:hypothetical protein [Oscillospiraceae bacterium]